MFVLFFLKIVFVFLPSLVADGLPSLLYTKIDMQMEMGWVTEASITLTSFIFLLIFLFLPWVRDGLPSLLLHTKIHMRMEIEKGDGRVHPPAPFFRFPTK